VLEVLVVVIVSFLSPSGRKKKRKFVVSGRVRRAHSQCGPHGRASKGNQREGVDASHAFRQKDKGRKTVSFYYLRFSFARGQHLAAASDRDDGHAISVDVSHATSVDDGETFSLVAPSGEELVFKKTRFRGNGHGQGDGQ